MDERLILVIKAAVVSLEKAEQLSDELSKSNTMFDNDEVVERAKGILMFQRSFDEDQAYKLLAHMALKKKMKLSNLSTQLIDVAKMLVI